MYLTWSNKNNYFLACTVLWACHKIKIEKGTFASSESKPNTYCAVCTSCIN